MKDWLDPLISDDTPNWLRADITIENKSLNVDAR